MPEGDTLFRAARTRRGARTSARAVRCSSSAREVSGLSRPERSGSGTRTPLTHKGTICVRAGSQVAFANPNRPVARGGGSGHPPRRPNLGSQLQRGNQRAASARPEPAEPRGRATGEATLGLATRTAASLRRDLATLVKCEPAWASAERRANSRGSRSGPLNRRCWSHPKSARLRGALPPRACVGPSPATTCRGGDRAQAGLGRATAHRSLRWPRAILFVEGPSLRTRACMS